jgi:hypothetical protein
LFLPHKVRKQVFEALHNIYASQHSTLISRFGKKAMLFGIAKEYYSKIP